MQKIGVTVRVSRYVRRSPPKASFTSEGKLDFHAARTAFVTLLSESDVTVKEAMELARHSTPQLTMNTYARTRQDRLSAAVEKLGEKVLFGRSVLNTACQKTPFGLLGFEDFFEYEGIDFSVFLPALCVRADWDGPNDRNSPSSAFRATGFPRAPRKEGPGEEGVGVKPLFLHVG